MFYPSSLLGTFPRKYRLVGLLFALLLACSVLFSLIGTASAAPAAKPSAVTFANHNWNCLTAACTKRVKAGQAQNNYECAEFVARSLAYAGDMPGLSATSAQSKYHPYHRAGYKHTYDLLLITPIKGLYTLSDYLIDQGHATNVGHNLSKTVAGDVVVFEDSHHVAQHTALIVVKGKTISSTLVDAHNSARYHVSISFYTSEFPYWYILHVK